MTPSPGRKTSSSRRTYSKPAITTEPLDRAGRCYDQAAEALLVGRLRDEPTAVLVHGYPRLNRPPAARYGHAWCEYTLTLPLEVPAELKRADPARRAHVEIVQVFDPSQDFDGPAALFYLLGSIDPEECTRYTRVEAARATLAHGHHGPWEPTPRGYL